MGSLLFQLLLLPQLPSLPPLLLMLLPLLPLLPPLLLTLLLPLLLLLLLLLPLLLDQSALSSRLRMNSATLLTDIRTSTPPSRSRETPTEESPDLTPTPMRLESTLSTMLPMTSDSELPETTSQLPLFTTLPSQLPLFTTLPLLLIPQRLLRPRPLSSLLLRLRLPGPRGLLSSLLSAQLLMLVLPLVFSQLPQLPLLPMLLPLLLLPLPVRLSSPPSS